MFGAHPYTGNVFFARFFSFFFDLKIARDDSGLEYTNNDLGTDCFCKKVIFYVESFKVRCSIISLSFLFN